MTNEDDDDVRDADLSDLLDQQTVMELSAAIRRGDMPEAELLLDRIAADDHRVEEWVQQARYSVGARPQQPALAKAA